MSVFHVRKKSGKPIQGKQKDDTTESEVDGVGGTALARGFCGLQNSPRGETEGLFVLKPLLTRPSHVPALFQCSD